MLVFVGDNGYYVCIEGEMNFEQKYKGGNDGYEGRSKTKASKNCN